MEVFKSEESVNLAHYFPYDVKLRLLADSRSFLANQKARNAIVGAENLLNIYIYIYIYISSSLSIFEYQTANAGSKKVNFEENLLKLIIFKVKPRNAFRPQIASFEGIWCSTF